MLSIISLVIRRSLSHRLQYLYEWRFLGYDKSFQAFFYSRASNEISLLVRISGNVVEPKRIRCIGKAYSNNSHLSTPQYIYTKRAKYNILIICRLRGLKAVGVGEGVLVISPLLFKNSKPQAPTDTPVPPSPPHTERDVAPSVRSWCTGSLDQAFMADPLSLFLVSASAPRLV